MSAVDEEKRIAAEAAAELVGEGMTVGLGTGSTVAHLLPALAARGLRDIRCVATSVATEERARGLGIPVEDFDRLERLDVAIDGADEVDPAGWLIKGGGAAHQREKIVAAAAERFVVIADSGKPVERLRGAVPLELIAFGLASTLARLGPDVRLREGAPPSPDAGAIADYRGEIGDPAALAARLEADPGVSAHGLFPPAMVADVLIGRGDEVERRTIAPAERVRHFSRMVGRKTNAAWGGGADRAAGRRGSLRRSGRWRRRRGRRRRRGGSRR